MPYCVDGFCVDTCHDREPFNLVVVVELFMVPFEESFIYFLQKFPNFCGHICGLGLSVRIRG